MNVVFRLPTEADEERFCKEAEKLRMIGLRGHRSVGGIRVSLYNAVEPAWVDALAAFMGDFGHPEDIQEIVNLVESTPAHDSRALKKLDATEDQKARIKPIADDLGMALSGFREEHKVLRSRFVKSLEAEKVDPAEVARIRADALALADRATGKIAEAIVKAPSRRGRKPAAAAESPDVTTGASAPEEAPAKARRAPVRRTRTSAAETSVAEAAPAEAAEPSAAPKPTRTRAATSRTTKASTAKAASTSGAADEADVAAPKKRAPRRKADAAG
jgi:hypothetical protein